MKISLFSHNAIIGVDTPLCHKSESYIANLILHGEAEMLPPGGFRRPAARLRPPKGVIADLADLVSAAHETAANSAISNTEMEANVGIAKSQMTVLNAQMKIKAWMSKATEDERSPLPRGKWYDSSRIQIVVVQ